MARRVAGAQRVAADPAIAARKAIAIREALARPDVRARHKAGCKAAMKRRMEDPIAVEKLRENGRVVGRYNVTYANTPEAREKRGLMIRSRHLAWCPAEQWAFNHTLKRKGYRLEERKRIILEGSAPKRETGAETVQRIAREMLEKHRREVASRY